MVLVDEKCPNPTLLVEFLQGKLAPPDLEKCESHIESCDVCHETLRGLNPSDTLSSYVVKAMQPATTADLEAEVVENLVHRLAQSSELKFGASKNLSIRNSVLQDRAAEVLQYVTSDSDNPQGLGTLAGFQSLELIGAGGTGVVFRAHDISLDREVALKVLRPSLGDIARERFVAEARAAASIDHQNVVTIFQVGQQERLAWIAMQWVPGETLESCLLREGTLNAEETRRLTNQIARGLKAAHRQQLVHRDIKPANIWIRSQDQQIRILDFGLVRITDSDPALTATGMLAGTPNFMSPEQAKGQELDARSDLFSLGCVMYQMLTSNLPFGSSTILATLQAIQNQRPETPIEAGADCSDDLSDLTMALLEKQPTNRIPSADSLVKCLEEPRNQWPTRVRRYKTVKAKGDGQAPQLAERKTGSEKDSAGSGFGNRFWITAVLLGLLAWPLWLFAPQIIRITTNQGELVIETEDENVSVEIRENGEVVRVLDADSDAAFDIRSGSFEISAIGSDGTTAFQVTPNQLVMNRGQREVVRVTQLKKSASASSPTAALDANEPNNQESVFEGQEFDHWYKIALVKSSLRIERRPLGLRFAHKYGVF